MRHEALLTVANHGSMLHALELRPLQEIRGLEETRPVSTFRLGV